MELNQIEAARDRLAGHVVRTPLVASPTLSTLCGRPVHLKLETRQTTGSFKLRGAANALLSLDAAALQRGLVTASSGNHGRALAHVARELGVRTIVCMSALVPDNKVAAARALGAEVRIVGRSQDEAQNEVDRLVREEGLSEISPFDAPAVIAGQGTVGLEIVDDLPNVELVVVPLSGGGLAGGVAAAVKARVAGARVVGVSMARGAAMHASLAAGRPVPVEEVETLADALGGGIGAENRYTLRLCAALLDGVVLLSESEIAAGICHAARVEHETVEGAGGVGIAALLAGHVAVRGPVAVVISGRNIDPALHRRIIAGSDA